MTARTLEQIQELNRIDERREAILARSQGLGVTGEMAQRFEEELAALNERRAELTRPAAPAPTAAATAARDLSPKDAAAKAAEIRARPEWFKGRRADGTRLTTAEHEQLVQEHAALSERAAEES